MFRTSRFAAAVLVAATAAAALAGCGAKRDPAPAPARSYAPATAATGDGPPTNKAGETIPLPADGGMPLVDVSVARPHCGTTRYAWTFSGASGADIPADAKPVAPAGQDFCEVVITVRNGAHIPARWLLPSASTLAVGPTTYDQTELADAITFELNSQAEHAGKATCYFADGNINPGGTCTQYAVYQVPAGARPTALNIAADDGSDEIVQRVTF